MWFYSFPAFMMVQGLDEPWGQGRKGNCCYGLQSFWKHSVPNGVRSFLLLCLFLCILHRHAYPHMRQMEHHYVIGACACFLLSWFFGCTQKAFWMSQTKCIQFPCVSFWSACSEYQSQNLFFSIIIFNLSRTKRGCVIWWVYKHGLNLSPAANYISHIKI